MSTSSKYKRKSESVKLDLAKSVVRGCLAIGFLIFTVGVVLLAHTLVYMKNSTSLGHVSFWLIFAGALVVVISGIFSRILACYGKRMRERKSEADIHSSTYVDRGVTERESLIGEPNDTN